MHALTVDLPAKKGRGTTSALEKILGIESLSKKAVADGRGHMEEEFDEIEARLKVKRIDKNVFTHCFARLTE